MTCSHDSYKTCETNRCLYWTDAPAECVYRFHSFSWGAQKGPLKADLGDCNWDGISAVCPVHEDLRSKQAKPQEPELYLSPFTGQWT